MSRHQAASAINPAPSGAISYRSRHSRQSRLEAKWSVNIPEDKKRASLFFEIIFQPCQRVQEGSFLGWIE
jgi:hypothetical protein